tara:strand:- start:75 stop:263 length:189 start_codon:yes stop_codon:yes gene_type:complete
MPHPILLGPDFQFESSLHGQALGLETSLVMGPQESLSMGTKNPEFDRGRIPRTTGGIRETVS